MLNAIRLLLLFKSDIFARDMFILSLKIDFLLIQSNSWIYLKSKIKKINKEHCGRAMVGLFLLIYLEESKYFSEFKKEIDRKNILVALNISSNS